MRRLLVPIILTLAILLYAGYRVLVLPPADVVLDNGARLDWVPCWFEVPIGRVTHCAHFFPRHDADETPIRLPVVVFRHVGLDHRTSPVLYLAGGPGGSAWLGQDEVTVWYDWLDGVDWPHDFVVFDQRGTGLSRPTFDCPETRELSLQLLQAPPSVTESMARGYAALQRCHDRLQTTGIDLGRYNTPDSARDVRDLMASLSDKAWNLYGVSYGTRLAMEVQRQFPARVRSVILDSVYPPDVDGTMSWPWLLEHSLERLFGACRADPACAARHPELRTRFVGLLARLADDPMLLSIPHPRTGQMLEVRVNDERLVSVVFDALYQWDLIGELPAAIDALWSGDARRLRPLVALHVGSLLDPGFSDAVYLSVECHDAQPFDRERYLDAVRAHPLVAPYTGPVADYDVCAFWDSGHAPPRFFEPVASTLPTLLLAGEMDPITPAEWAEEAVKGFPNGYLLEFAGIGHSVIDSDTCGVEVARRFLAEPERRPDATCMNQLPPVQFVP